MEIVKIVKFLQKEKYAEFLSEICTMHYFQNYFFEKNYFIKNEYTNDIKKKYGFENEHMILLNNLNIDSVVLVNTEKICFFHKNLLLPKPCSLRILLEKIKDLVENYNCFINEIHIQYEEKNLILTCTYQMNFIVNVFIHYPSSDIKPIVSKHKVSCINHLYDVLIDNILFAKKLNGTPPIRIIYTLYDLVDHKFLETNSPYDYQKLVNEFYNDGIDNVTNGIENVRL